ncbi:succinyl-diaminopimelate desuccinylase [Agrilactobacillus composti DSM 18527 = JCM 14202]|uniref:Succinyl-diaminopimelate desuccinylase n=1 Tax=Agrilactobacillus composti DSM 18527 = JCM 14202 TaxID=1423734 RepID=X0PMY0_9LACO|nr:M20/M25/M40 family metallo-hydrolase [Agrilactobacillus composti]KRM30419.1 succinyl-diaminopimelate desuccinylase [Agrilactobacillus composti DSM 18527 = JCM 14202]GAF38892.1 acetylornithine deacetylase [Agrilactobacillus composti DSM 18527 = JCM 14202]
MFSDDEKVKILQDLIRIPSVNDHEKTVTDYLTQLLAQYGIAATAVTYKPNRNNLVAEIDSGQPGPVLVFSGHADVVHEGDRHDWQQDPFEPWIENGRLYGRGTSDMKGGLAALVIAMIEFKASGHPFTGKLRLLVTAGEEVGELGSKQLANLGYVDDVDAMIIGEPTGVAKEKYQSYVASGTALLSSELQADILADTEEATAGQHFIFFAHKGWVTYKVTAHGRAAHSSMPKVGVNALELILAYFQREKAFYEGITAYNPVLGETVYAPTIIRGGTQVNSIPDTASLQVKVRTIPEYDNERIIAGINQIIAELNATTEGHFTLEYDSKRPVINHRDSPIIALAQKIGQSELHERLPLPVIGVSLGTDASEFTRANPDIDVVILGPGNTSAHKANEYVTIASYLNMIQTYHDIAVEYLQ